MSHKPNFPKKFYKTVSLDEENGIFHLTLDGKRTKTPAKNSLGLPNLEAALLLQEEWHRQENIIDPSDMHITRMVNAAIDHVSKVVPDVQCEIAKYATTELLCYRAAQPEKLVLRQNEQWNPVLDWINQKLGAKFYLSEGVMFVAQPSETLNILERETRKFNNPVALSAFYTLVTIGGSLCVALAIAYKHLDPLTAYKICELEADFTNEIYGIDEEAQFRYVRRKQEFITAASLLKAMDFKPS